MNLDFLSEPCATIVPREEDVLSQMDETFILPPMSNSPSDVAAFAACEFEGKDRHNIKFNHGTTTLAFVYKEGLVVAVDSRASRGPEISSQTVKKVIPIHPWLLGTMAGGAADCQYWERVLSTRCRLYELRNKERISVAAASKILTNIVYGYKGYGLSMGTMIAGWDQTGPNLYYVDNDGTRLKGQLFSVGSGSTYAYGVLDNEYKFDMDETTALNLGRRAIYHATHRDAYSGGTINVFHINKDGWRQVSADDCNDLHWDRYTQGKE